MYMHANCNKRSVVMNLKLDAARSAWLRLAKDCDLFIANHPLGRWATAAC